MSNPFDGFGLYFVCLLIIMCIAFWPRIRDTENVSSIRAEGTLGTHYPYPVIG